MLEKIVAWRSRRISDRHFTLLLSLFVGFFAAVAGYVLHLLIHQIQLLLTSGFDVSGINWLYLLFPVVGIWLTSLFVKYLVKDNISHGITRVLYAIATKRSHLRSHNTWTSVVASAITIGFGGSVGAEAPIVLTGSAIGSNLGRLFRLDNRTLMLLVGCGASAAIAGIFKTPIAGLVFTIEVLMIDLTMSSLLPIMISTVTKARLAGWLGPRKYRPEEAERTEDAVGIVTGLVSLYFMRMMTACEDMFARMSEHRYLRLLIGGLMLSTLIFLFPSLYGEGYDSLSLLIEGSGENDWNRIMQNSLFAGNGKLLVLYVALVVVTKVFATSATNGAGGCGGTFAPSLFIGGFSGFLFARLWNIYNVGQYVPERHFTLYGMAGVMAGVMHAPLTGIFLIAELTGGYQLFIPLIIVTISSYLTISIFESHSIYAQRLARHGHLLTHHTDKAALTLMTLEPIIDTELTRVSPDTEMGRLVREVSRSTNSYIPVCDDDGRLLGEIDITRLRHVIFRTELYHRFTVRQLMTQPAAVLSVGDPMEEVMQVFEQTGAAALPVVDSDKRLKGFVSRARLFTAYRQMVADLSQE